MDYKIGDRFEREGMIFEIIGPSDEHGRYSSVCKKAHSGWEIGDVWKFTFDPKQWKFIGNFAKSANFNNLFDLLLDNP